MPLSIVYSRANLGMCAPLVTIEVHVAPGLPGMSIVGLPEKAVKESKDRVRCAILNNHYEFPPRRIVINLAPADLPKEGGRFDLPIAIGILAAMEQIPIACLSQYEFIGELALDGTLKPVNGVLPMALAMKDSQRALILPEENKQEASLAAGLSIFPANHLRAICNHLKNTAPLKPLDTNIPLKTSVQYYPDLADVRGQAHAKRTLEIAAAGGHSLLFTGPPGSGKTMLASRLPGILPDMTNDEAQSTAMVYSVSTQGFNQNDWKKRPFRTPHHTASSPALVGGGNPPKPGEISLAHHGVLFLDELPEFNRQVLEALREPLEAGIVTISRATRQSVFPSRFQLIAAMNPCPCGYAGDVSGRCQCGAEQIQRYQNRLSGPLLDRIDMHITVPPCPPALLLKQSQNTAENSAAVRNRVLAARAIQYHRAQCINAQLLGETLSHTCILGNKERAYLEKAIDKLGLSARAYHRVLKVARTVADLDTSEMITEKHLQESLSYRFVKMQQARYH